MLYKNTYHTWAEFMEKVQRGKRTTGWTESLERGNAGWNGTYSMEEALNHLKGGLHQGMDTIERHRQHIPTNLFDLIMPQKDFTPELQHVIAGGTVDVAAHLSGATPLTFISEVTPQDPNTHTKRGSRLKTIYVNITNSANVNIEMFMERGALIWLLVEHLEKCGFSTQVWCFISLSLEHRAVYGTTPESKAVNLIKVKDFSEPFDLNKMAISLCSAFMFRRFGFALMEMATTDYEKRVLSTNYGYPVVGDNGEDVIVPEDKNLYPLYFNTANIYNAEAMRRYFKKQLENHLGDTLITD